MPLEADVRRRLRDGAIGGLVLVALMNVAGISLNLFVTVTDTSGYSGVFPAMFATVQGAVHVLVGIALFIGGVIQIFTARRCTDRRFLGLTLIALVSLIGAAYSGYHFVYSGESTYSFAMEIGFLGVVLAEAFILALLIGPPARTRPNGPTSDAVPISGSRFEGPAAEV